MGELFLLAFLGSVCGLSGGLFFLYYKPWAKWLSLYSVPFAAGVLLTVSLLGILPEAIHLGGEDVLYYVFFAFVGSFLFEHFVFALHHHDHHVHGDSGSKTNAAALMVVLGDSLHNFVDGVTIAAAYMISPGLGLIAAISTFLHEVPHEIGDFGILLKAGWPKLHIVLANLFSSMVTFLGVLAVLYFKLDEVSLSGALGIAAGMFLYLAASDFLPDITNKNVNSRKALVVFLSGVAIMLLILRLVPHES